MAYYSLSSLPTARMLERQLHRPESCDLFILTDPVRLQEWIDTHEPLPTDKIECTCVVREVLEKWTSPVTEPTATDTPTPAPTPNRLLSPRKIMDVAGYSTWEVYYPGIQRWVTCLVLPQVDEAIRADERSQIQPPPDYAPLFNWLWSLIDERPKATEDFLHDTQSREALRAILVDPNASYDEIVDKLMDMFAEGWGLSRDAGVIPPPPDVELLADVYKAIGAGDFAWVKRVYKAVEALIIRRTGRLK